MQTRPGTSDIQNARDVADPYVAGRSAFGIDRRFWTNQIHISMTVSLHTSSATPLSEVVATTDGPYQLHGLERAVSVLEILSESQEPLSLAEICRRMNLHKSTAHRSLMVLERSALIERTSENRFRLGLKLYELGNRAVEQIDLRARVYPFFRRLAMDVRETVHLGVLQKTSVVYLDKVEPNRKICMSSKTGSSNPVYCTSLGKAMLAVVFALLEVLPGINSQTQRILTQTTYAAEPHLEGDAALALSSSVTAYN